MAAANIPLNMMVDGTLSVPGTLAVTGQFRDQSAGKVILLDDAAVNLTTANFFPGVFLHQIPTAARAITFPTAAQLVAANPWLKSALHSHLTL